MDNVEKLVRERRSVRTFDGHGLTAEDREKLCAFIAQIDNPYGLPIAFTFLEKMGCPVVVGTDLYLGAKMKDAPHMNEAFGYAFEKLVLYAQSLGIGTVLHHIYNFGTCSQFVSMGKERYIPIVDNKEHITIKKMMQLGLTTDERICDGLYFARAVRYMKKLLAHPEVLEQNVE